jgi:hypothetical protein
MEPALLGEAVDSKVEERKYKMSFEHLIMTEIKEEFKKNLGGVASPKHPRKLEAARPKPKLCERENK